MSAGVQLFYKKYEGGANRTPLFILHGLLGSGDNWSSLARKFSVERDVYCVDLRNHGKSPHSTSFGIKEMVSDVHELIQQLELSAIILMGHSMGGKVAMQYTLDYPNKIEKLISVDMAPKAYTPHHSNVFEALNKIPVDTIKSRKEAENIVSVMGLDIGTSLFLLKNLERTENGFKWKMNLPVIQSQYQNILGEVKGDPSDNDALFISGGRSEYIRESDKNLIKEKFRNSSIEVLENAGHWLHAEQPDAFFEKVHLFIS